MSVKSPGSVKPPLAPVVSRSRSEKSHTLGPLIAEASAAPGPPAPVRSLEERSVDPGAYDLTPRRSVGVTFRDAEGPRWVGEWGVVTVDKMDGKGSG